MISSKIAVCRLCGNAHLDNILDLGIQPPANSLRKRLGDKLETIPLVICRCTGCSTVQLTETVSPEYLFRNYVWVTGTSETACRYSQVFYDNVCARLTKKTMLVVEVASNDGTFLKPFREHGHRVLGVDPARNLAELARASGIATEAEFFGSKTAERLVRKYGEADVLIARNVIPHTPEPNDLTAGLRRCLGDDGMGVIEFHWVQHILNELHYDSIYHEHFFYHSLHSIEYLLNRQSLYLFDVTESPISGGSLVVYFAKKPRPKSAALRERMNLETDLGLASLETWQSFAQRSLDHRAKLKKLIDDQVKMGKKIIGYGASARSSTLLNFCGLSSEHLICIADKSLIKLGSYTPGTNILIVSPEEAMKRQPDAVLILAWNFREEILGKLVAMNFHGEVIIPLPFEPEVYRL